MNLESIEAFNKYVRLNSSKHTEIDLGSYPENYLLQSSPVYPGFYRVSLKHGLEKDRDKAYMYFSAPNQAIEWNTEVPLKGYYLHISESLISNNNHLRYSFLSYGLHEPLSITKEEDETITVLFEQAIKEYRKEKFSLSLLISYFNLIFSHVSQFHERQFTENKKLYSKSVDDFLMLLNNYYQKENSNTVQPSVAYFAEKLNITPNYLSDLIKFYTGQTALEHIHKHIIETAKLLLDEKKLNIRQVATSLGFEYPNYFSRLFRNMTGISPSKYRNL